MALPYHKERQMYKQTIEEKLNEFLESERAQNIIKTFKLQDYQFIIAKRDHVDSIINLMVKQYKKSNPVWITFDLEPKIARLLVAPSLKSKIEADRVLMAVDKRLYIHYLYFIC